MEEKKVGKVERKARRKTAVMLCVVDQVEGAKEIAYSLVDEFASVSDARAYVAKDGKPGDQYAILRELVPSLKVVPVNTRKVVEG